MKHKTTPPNITSLEPGQIFVFGSNEAGRHGLGAALTARLKFGAEPGVGYGPTGHCYAIPTKDRFLQVLPLATIGKQVGTFRSFAMAHPELTFLVTAIGCGLAAYEPSEIAPFFENPPPNVWLPQRFWEVIGENEENTITTEQEYHGLDTAERVCFYEQDFYVLSNFSSFQVTIWGVRFPTSEHAYHWKKFHDVNEGQHIKQWILNARSAHDAFKLAQDAKFARRPDWDEVKVDVMREILRAKSAQHEYVRRKLLATGDRELVENSWRDDFWGWGPNRDGQNMLGKLWMEIRAELQSES